MMMPMSTSRILIADDDADCLALLELALTAPDTIVMAATNGGELLELIAEHGPFDLIVTDINMPWMEGLQVLASVREAGLGTPVLVVTGVTRPHLTDAVARMTHARLLRKPFTVAQLREAVAALARSEAEGNVQAEADADALP